MRKRILVIVSFLFAIVAILLMVKLYDFTLGQDTQCTTLHTTSSKLPVHTVSATDYFAAGNYYYDVGNCTKAISEYSKAIQLNTQVPQFYNNRGYTYMRLHEYAKALQDMDTALLLNPNYINARLNRGDLYNYYGPIIDRQKAIADYQRVIALHAVHDNSVCGHLAMAQTNDLIPLALLKFVLNRGHCE